MWFGRWSRRVLCYSTLAFVMMLVLQMWVCCHSCQAGAIRIFPAAHMEATVTPPARANTSGSDMDKEEKEKEKKKKEEYLFDKFFKGMRTLGANNKSNEGFEESKRRVPSCPDPLHN